jgi:hypothetical protein
MGIISRARDAFRRTGAATREETYLGEATSLVDLEQRQREIDRGRFRRTRQWPY